MSAQITRTLDRPQRNSREERSERTFTLVLVETDAGFKWGTLDAPGYLLELVYGELRYRRVALQRLDSDWKWKGVLHEALVSPYAAQA